MTRPSASLSMMIALATLAGATLAGAQQPMTIKREESKLQIDIPELGDFREIFQWIQAPNYASERYYVAVVPREGAYPRLQVNLDLIYSGFYYREQPRLDEAEIRRWPFFKDRPIAGIDERTAASNETVRITRFAGDDAPCFLFSAFLTAIGHANSFAQPDARQRLSGFFCGAPGSALSEDEVSHVLAGLRVRSGDRVLGVPGSRRSRLLNVPKPAG